MYVELDTQVEAKANESINNYFDAFYFSVTTLTTVGFGDIVPVTSLGRATIVAVIIAGTGASLEYVMSHIKRESLSRAAIVASILAGIRVRLEYVMSHFGS